MVQADSPSTAAQTPPVDVLAFRQAAGQFLTGVTIVTTLAEDGAPRGVTANSFTSVSLDPPLVLTCIGKSSRSYRAFATADVFAVNVLAAEQKTLSATFSSRSEDKFAGVEWRAGRGGAPLLPGCIAQFDCTLHQRIDAGDHIVLIGRVVGLEMVMGNPLGYFAGNYVDFAVQWDSTEPR
jgi:flavin reductase (DIM6/NTAB) family NADH-FMN oxidoreductase RutF